MPIYEYRCGDCQRVTEILLRAGESAPPRCPFCQSPNLKKIFSLTAPPQMGEAASPCASGSCAGNDGLPSCAHGHCPHGGH